MDPNNQNNQNDQNNFQNAAANFTNMPDSTSQFDPADIQANKTMGILAYIGFLVLVPIFSAKESRFAKFHANQGLALFIVELAIGVLNTISWYIPLIGGIIRIVLSLVSLAVLIVAIMGILAASKGEAKKMPIIGNITILK